MFEAMELKPKLQLRHKGAGEATTHHQGNLQEPNGANLKKKAYALLKAKP